MRRTEALPEQTRMLSAPDLVSSLTKGMMEATTQILEKFTCPPPVDDAADAAIREHFQQRRAESTWMIPAAMESSKGRVSTFDQLGHQAQTPQKEEEWEPRPEMTPRKVDRGCQSSRTASSEPPHSTSQKRQSQSWPQDKGESKKGRTENEGRSSKVQVRIDWSTMVIQKPVSKPDLRHLSFKPDPSGVSKDQQPRVKSTVVSKASQKQSSTHGAPSGFQEQSEGQNGRTSRKTSGPIDPEKVELRDKPYDWIMARIHWLDLKGYVEEIHSFRHFHRMVNPSHLRSSRSRTGAVSVSMSAFSFPCPCFLITYSTSLLDPNREEDKFLPNPIIWLRLEEMSGPSAGRAGSGWLPSYSSGWMKHPSLMANCLGVKRTPSVPWRNTSWMQ